MRILFLVLLSVHVGIGLFVDQYQGDIILIPIVNLAIAITLIIYWADRWYTYLADHVYINKASALVILFSVLVLILSVMQLTGHDFDNMIHWSFYTIHSITLILLLVFYRVFQRNRLF